MIPPSERRKIADFFSFFPSSLSTSPPSSTSSFSSSSTSQSLLPSLLEVGVWLPFAAPPPVFIPPAYPQCIPSYFRDSFRSIISDYLARGIISRVSEAFARAISPVFLVPRPGKVPRLVLDLKRLNSLLVPPPKFSLPRVTSPPPLYSGRGSQGFTVDFESGFYSVEMHSSALPFLCFRGMGQDVYCFNRLVMGLSWAPFIFQTVSQAAVSIALSFVDGVEGCVYIDDAVFSSPKKDPDKRNVLLAIFQALGFSVNWSKSTDWSGQLQWLGFSLDLESNSILPLRSKVAKARREARAFARGAESPSLSFSVRAVASTLGRLTHLSPSFPSLLLITKPLQQEVSIMARTVGWKGTMSVLPSRGRSWRRVVDLLSQPPIPLPISPPPFTRILSTDASDLGTGWVLRDSHGNLLREGSRHFLGEDIASPINAKEYKALRWALEDCSDLVRDQAVLCRLDNTNCVSWVRKKTASWKARQDAFAVWSLARDLRFSLTPVWVPSKDQEADALSRKPLPNDWSLPPPLQRKLLRKFSLNPSETLEACAHPSSHLLPRFGYRGGSEDVLLLRWVREASPPWLHPPPRLWRTLLPRLSNMAWKAVVLIPSFMKSELQFLLRRRASPITWIRSSQLRWPQWGQPPFRAPLACFLVDQRLPS